MEGGTHFVRSVFCATVLCAAASASVSTHFRKRQYAFAARSKRFRRFVCGASLLVADASASLSPETSLSATAYGR